MSIRIYNRLTWSLVSRFGDRKEHGYLSLIVNVENDEIYIVPHEKEHIMLVEQLLSVDRNYIRKNSDIASHLVPSIIEIQDSEVKGVLTGFSGLESGFKVRHTEEQLDRAHVLVLAFVENGEIPRHPDFEEHVDLKWAA